MEDNYLQMLFEFVNKGEYDKAYQFWAEQTPEYIYKCIGLGKEYDKLTLENLRYKKLYFNHVANYDDKYEFKSVQYISNSKFGEELANRDIKLKLNKNLISCFYGQMINDSIMWKNYANNGMGFKAKFKVIDRSFLRKVFYTDETYYIKEIKGNLEEQQSIIERNKFLKELSYYLKNLNKWGDQNEYRVIMDCEKCNLPIEKILYPDNYVSFDSFLKLETIEIGNMVDKEGRQKLINICNQMQIKCCERKL